MSLVVNATLSPRAVPSAAMTFTSLPGAMLTFARGEERPGAWMRSVTTPVVSLGTLGCFAGPTWRWPGDMCTGDAFPRRCVISLLPIASPQKIPILVPTSSAFVSGVNFTTACFWPSVPILVFTNATLASNARSIAVLIACFVASRRTMNSSLLSRSIAAIVFSVTNGWRMTSYALPSASAISHRLHAGEGALREDHEASGVAAGGDELGGEHVGGRHVDAGQVARRRQD